MGACQLALFAGFAIYLPELFPTRLRSTGTSFCYNVGRFVAAFGILQTASIKAWASAGADTPVAKIDAFRNAASYMSVDLPARPRRADLPAGDQGPSDAGGRRAGEIAARFIPSNKNGGRPFRTSAVFFCAMAERLLLRLPVADELHALLHFGQRVVPVVFVFDRDVALEALGLQLGEDVADSGRRRCRRARRGSCRSLPCPSDGC